MTNRDEQAEGTRGSGGRSRAAKLTAAAASIAGAAAISTAGTGTAEAVHIPLPFGASVDVTGGLALGTDFVSAWADPQLNVAGVLPWGWGAASGGIMPLGGRVGWAPVGGQVNWPAGWLGNINAFGIDWPINAGGSLGSLGCYVGGCPAVSPPSGWLGAYFPFSQATGATPFGAGSAVPVQTVARAADVSALTAPATAPSSTWAIRIPGPFGGSLSLSPSITAWLGTGAGTGGGVGADLTLPWGWGGGTGSIDFGSVSAGWDGVRLDLPGGAIGGISAFGLYFPATLRGDLGAIGVNSGGWPYWVPPAVDVSVSAPLTAATSVGQLDTSTADRAVDDRAGAGPAPSNRERTVLPDVADPVTPKPKTFAAALAENEAPAAGGTTPGTVPTATTPTGSSAPTSDALDDVVDAVSGLGHGGPSASGSESEEPASEEPQSEESPSEAAALEESGTEGSGTQEPTDTDDAEPAGEETGTGSGTD